MRERTIDDHLAALRRRALVVYGARALVSATGAVAAVLAMGALALGPLAGLTGIGAVWAVGLALAALVGVWGVRELGDIRGAKVARLYADAAPGLASAARSASELSRNAPGDASSRTLRQAHRRATLARVAALELRRVVPWSRVRHRSSELGLGALVLAALVVSASPRAAGGLYALLHPAARAPDGAPVAAVFERVRARVLYPAYFGRAPLELADPALIEVPAGATVELFAHARIAVGLAELEVAGHAIALERTEGGALLGRFVARQDGELVLRARTSEGSWARDAARRTLHVSEDRAPVVHLLEPETDRVVEPDDEVAIAFRAGDDVALGDVTIVLRTADGREERRAVAGVAAGAVEHAGHEIVTLAELAAEPGDRVTVHVEARDRDDEGGPNVGRSESRTLTLASDATRRAEGLADLEAIALLALDTLADRLEHPVDEGAEAAAARFAVLREPTQRLVEAISSFSVDIEDRAGFRATDAPIYRDLARDVRRLLAEERRLHEPTVAGVAPRRDVDERAVAKLEEAVLTLGDLLLRAQAEDAAAIARELEALRREMTSLLSELRRAETPEARAAILAAIARAEQRLSDLRARLGEMMHRAPSEFGNSAEGEAAATADALATLREAVERGDLDAAARALTELEQVLDGLAAAIGDTGEAIGEEVFGPRDRALAEALDALLGLEAEERELARRTGETRTAAARRAIEESGAEASAAGERIAGRIAGLREALGEIEGDRLAMLERESLEATRARLSDTEVALRHGDLGEASRMAEEAEARMHELERDLELDAMMFPGHGHETADAARSAREASRGIGALRSEVEGAIPDVRRHVSADERARMREDAPRQDAAGDAAERLATSFERGPEGSPIAPDAAFELRSIAEEMSAAERALEAGDSVTASRAQDEAARRLTELRRQIESDASASSGGEGASRPDSSRPVRIPGADEFSGSMDARRRVLDAMGDETPAGWEGPVGRYYEELLR